jgi:hypothetical protein
VLEGAAAGDRLAEAAADLVGAVEAEEAEEEEEGAEGDEDGGVGEQAAEDQDGTDRDVDGGDQTGGAATATVATGEPGRGFDLLLGRQEGTGAGRGGDPGALGGGEGAPAGLPGRFVPWVRQTMTKAPRTIRARATWGR